MKTDNHVITVSSSDYTHVNVHNPYAVIGLVSWPDVTLNTAPFQVEIKTCTLSNAQWTPNSSAVLTHDYTIDSGA